jgi:hypothetical protein
MTAKKILLFVGVLALAGVALLYCWPPRLTDDGGFVLLETKPTPDGSKVAEVFAYRGGATVRGFSVLLIRPKDQKISPEDFSTRVADSEGPGKPEISWVSDERLRVQFPTADHRLLQQMAFGVAIEEQQIR